MNTHLQDESLIAHPSLIKYNGVTFKPDVFILLSYDVFDPVFCKICDLLNTDAGIFIVYHEFLTHSYDYHYHGYIIKQTNKPLCIMKIDSLPFFLVIHPRRTFNQNESHLYVSLKTHIE